MKVLFLDIDGVLTSARAHSALSWGGEQAVWHKFDPVAIGFLNRLVVENPTLLFVLSSTWRKFWDRQTMTMFLSSQGWKGLWHQNWKTPVLNKSRGEEIEAWRLEHKPDHYVILDDDADMLEHQLPHFVRTDGQNGMNNLNHFLEAQAALKRKPYNV